jgi:hypothetical protein
MGRDLVMNRLLNLLGTLLAVCAAGCTPELTCDEEFTGGGNLLTGGVDANANGAIETKWVVVEPCENIVSSPPYQDTLVKQPPHLAGEAPPDPGSGDWCQSVVFRTNRTIERLNTWFPRVPIRQHSPISAGQTPWYDASLTYEGNTYSFAAILYGRQKLELSKRCLEAQGVSLTCDELTGAIREVWNAEPAVQNLICGPHASGSGCQCDYDLILNTGPAGTWANSGPDLVTHFDGAQGPPFQANYRVDGNMLSMSGYNRRTLFGISGMRTLKFARVNCTDNAQGPGEDGIDCGPYCAACP